MLPFSHKGQSDRARLDHLTRLGMRSELAGQGEQAECLIERQLVTFQPLGNGGALGLDLLVLGVCFAALEIEP